MPTLSPEQLVWTLTNMRRAGRQWKVGPSPAATASQAGAAGLPVGRAAVGLRSGWCCRQPPRGGPRLRSSSAGGAPRWFGQRRSPASNEDGARAACGARSRRQQLTRTEAGSRRTRGSLRGARRRCAARCRGSASGIRGSRRCGSQPSSSSAWRGRRRSGPADSSSSNASRVSCGMPSRLTRTRCIAASMQLSHARCRFRTIAS